MKLRELWWAVGPGKSRPNSPALLETRSLYDCTPRVHGLVHELTIDETRSEPTKPPPHCAALFIGHLPSRRSQYTTIPSQYQSISSCSAAPRAADASYRFSTDVRLSTTVSLNGAPMVQYFKASRSK
jgi:hypothetical protein